jgi:uncharacterized protein YdaU (DUF1376 family)
MLPFYPFYWGDYSAKTFNLTQGQHGAYMLFLRHCYTTGERIPHDERYSIAKATLSEEQSNADLVLSKFFSKKGGEWSNSKVDEVLNKQHERHQALVEAGKRGGRPSKATLKAPLSDTKALPKQLEPEPELSIIRMDAGDQFAILEKQMREAAGWQSEPHPNLLVIGPIIAAIAGGVDLEMDLLPAARAHGPTLQSRTSWKYILQAAISNRNNRLQAASDASKPFTPNQRQANGTRSNRPGNLANLLAD